MGILHIRDEVTGKFVEIPAIIGAPGPQGIQGPQGKKFQILGVHTTYDELISHVTSPEQGDHYDVGPDDNGQYTMFMYDTQKGWVNKGIMQGGGTGDGTVKYFNDIEPDEEGNIKAHISDLHPDPDAETATNGYVRLPIQADNSEKLGGRAASDYSLINHSHSASDVGALAKDEQAADSAKLGGKTPEYYSYSVNLLTNSNFTNPINTHGGTTYTGADRGIDEWLGFTTGSTQIVEKHCVTFSGQYRQNFKHDVGGFLGKTVTIACQTTDGTIYCASGVIPETLPADTVNVCNATAGSNKYIRFVVTATSAYAAIITTSGVLALKWIALYEGTFTVDTIPEYHAPDLHVEMMRMGCAQPENLLKNSNFLNPINHNGYVNKTNITSTYFIDQWRASGSGSFNLDSSGLTIVSGSALQIIPAHNLKTSKTYTLACKVNNTVLCFNGSHGASIGNWDSGLIASYQTNGDYYVYLTKTGSSYEWAVFCENSYTVDNITAPIKLPQRLEMLNVGLSTQPTNLLDNSNFANVIAQAGLGTYTYDDAQKIYVYTGKHGDEPYAADRWMNHGCTIAQHDGYARLSTPVKGRIYQKLQNLSGKTITAAVKAHGDGYLFAGIYYTTPDGSATVSIAKSINAPNGIILASGTIPVGATNIEFRIYPDYEEREGYIDVYWAALYEGAFTLETLPPYATKPYTIELAECQRYYLHIGAETWLMGHYVSGYGMIVEFSSAINMRSTPSVILDAPQVYHSSIDWVDLPTPYAKKAAQGVHLIFNNIGNSSLTAGYAYLMKGIQALSADL